MALFLPKPKLPLEVNNGRRRLLGDHTDCRPVRANWSTGGGIPSCKRPFFICWISRAPRHCSRILTVADDVPSVRWNSPSLATIALILGNVVERYKKITPCSKGGEIFALYPNKKPDVRTPNYVPRIKWDAQKGQSAVAADDALRRNIVSSTADTLHIDTQENIDRSM